jgi:hypothetical protein
MLVCLLDDLDDVLITPFGAKIVDPHAASLVAPVESLQRIDHLCAGRYLFARRHRVFEVQKDMIGVGRRRLDEHLFAGSWHGKLHAAATDWALVGHGVPI